MPTSMPPTRWAEFEAVAAEALRHAREGQWAGLAAAVDRLASLQAEWAIESAVRADMPHLERLLELSSQIVDLARAQRTRLASAIDSTRHQQRVMQAYATTRGAA